MCCALLGFNNQINHVKKRQLKGSLRQKIAGHLINAKKQATIWRTEEANRIMEFDDQDAPILFSPRVLLKAKQNELDNCLGITDCNTIENLQIYKRRFASSRPPLLPKINGMKKKRLSS